MRFSLPLQNKTTSIPSPFPWLRTLKTTQLQHIAQKTGIRSSGPKAVLIKNLELGLGLARCYPFASSVPQGGDSGGGSNSSGMCGHEERQMQQYEEKHLHNGNKGGMSILSIDMGIRNLAFAHLQIPPNQYPYLGSAMSAGSSIPTATLTAWRRLALPEKPLSLNEFARFLDAPTIEKAQEEEEEEGTRKKGKQTDGFAPAVYAQHAHTLISTLLKRYQPTHVLIERQRFRSGGGSAVQEWTLRVGVFEGMLYAVLYSLAVMSGAHVDASALEASRSRGGLSPIVVGVEPQRVARYWMDSGALGTNSGQKRLSAREGKKFKIDLVGNWLDRCHSNDLAGSNVRRVEVGGDHAVREWTDAYLAKWKGKGKGKRERTSTNTKLEVASLDGEENEQVPSAALPEIGKLDDLADCLVQGVTWLEWQVMRDRIARDGLAAAGLQF